MPLIIRAPWKNASVGQSAEIFAELVDMMPTLAELSGAPAPSDAIDGTSLAAVFDNPSLATLSAHDTHNKSVAYSQFPHNSDYGCQWFRDGKCFNTSSLTGTGAHKDFMGFRVRDHEYGFCIWLPWDASSGSATWPESLGNSSLVELYDHRADMGTDFNAMDVTNLAYLPEMSGRVQSMYLIAKGMFGTSGPGPTPSAAKTCQAAGGILAGDNIACCAQKCGRCGGHGCASLPGGKTNCCHSEVESNGKNCHTNSAPCSVTN